MYGRASILAMFLRSLRFGFGFVHVTKRVNVGHKTSLIPTLFIEVHVTSQDSERSCIGVSICLCFCDILGIVSTVVFLFFTLSLI
jgi:hypothetical protein